MTNLRQVFAQLVASAAFVIAGWHLVQQRNSRLTVCLSEGLGIVLSRLAVKPCWLVVVAAVPGALVIKINLIQLNETSTQVKAHFKDLIILGKDRPV